MPKNQILENITIDKLIFGGKGLGSAPDGRKVIITGGCIPGSIVNVRILKERKSHYEGQEIGIVKKSPIEIPLQPGHQVYGGAKWLTIGYTDQIKIKEEQLRDAFRQLSSYIQKTQWHHMIPSPEIYGYRNKVEFSWGKYISDREGIYDEFRFGFHAQGQFDRIINCTYCALADNEMNDIFREIDRFSRMSGFPTYDPKIQSGFWRHLVMRKGYKTGEIMLIFSIHHIWNDSEKTREGSIEYFFTNMVQQLTKFFPSITSIYIFENTGKADIVTGNPVLLFGRAYITEKLFNYTFEIQPKSFFQVNTLGAEKLYQSVIDCIRYKGGTLLDLYAGTGTIGIILSQYFHTIYSVEIIESASLDAQNNALLNSIRNMRCICDSVEAFAKKWKNMNKDADTIVIDPPREGVHPDALMNILSFAAREIIYISCNPATLVRDLEILIGKSRNDITKDHITYCITDIRSIDMFPHTHHIETVVRLEKREYSS